MLGKARVSWKIVCKPKENGGLGIRSLKEWNETLLLRQLWKIIEGKESLQLKEKVKPYVMYNIGNGNKISMWHDKWCEKGPLFDIITNRAIYDARFKNNAKVAEMIVDGRWIWSNEWR
ncbi:hypothetical protein Tco_0422160 [Tanacetum coccineum]